MASKSAAPAPKSATSSGSSSGSGEEEDVQLSQPQKKPAAAAAAPKLLSKTPIEEDSSTGDYSSSDDSASDSAAEPSQPAKLFASSSLVAAASGEKKRKEAPPPAPENNNESGGVDGQKRQRFQRLWSEADEIAILHGMLNHQAETGALPSKTNMATFRDTIQNNLTTGISVKQLTEKIRRLKSKYGKYSLTASSSKPQYSAVHELSHKIWRASNGAVSAGKNGKAKEGNDDFAKMKPRYIFLKHAGTRLVDYFPCSVTLEELLDFVDVSKATAIEESLKKLWKLKLKNRAREIEIEKEVNMVFMEALEKMG